MARDPTASLCRPVRRHAGALTGVETARRPALIPSASTGRPRRSQEFDCLAQRQPGSVLAPSITAGELTATAPQWLDDRASQRPGSC